MNFSIVLASRERSQLLVALMRSIQETTQDLGNIEVLVAIDNDDPESQDAARHISGWHSFVKFLSRDRSQMLNRDYLNWAYDTAGSGRYVIVCNDDACFRTHHWDRIILNRLDEYLKPRPDGIVYGFISDAILNRHGLHYCCFPLISRKGVEALGFCMPPEFPSWNADVALWQIYRSADRVCDLSEVMIEHVSYHSGKRGRDNVSFHVENISRGNYGTPIPHHVEKLNQAISKGGR